MIFYCALSIGRVFSATIKTCPNVHQVHHVVLTIEMSINMQNNEQTEYKTVRGLTRGLMLLNMLNKLDGGASVGLLAELSGLHRTTVRRLLETLCELRGPARALLTGERNGYYRDFGTVADLATAFQENFVYSGQYSAYRGRSHGNSARDIPARRFVVFAQNHDQVGNRMLGERLSVLGSFDDQKLAAGVTLLSPFLPLLFMGEEYGETAPFLYFVSHNDRDLIEAVRRGRREEFAAFGWPGAPPDPQAESTFLRSKIDWQLRSAPRHGTLCRFYRELIRLRRSLPALADRNLKNLRAIAREAVPENGGGVIIRTATAGRPAYR